MSDFSEALAKSLKKVFQEPKGESVFITSRRI